jgi:hypothetical protein
MPRQSTPLSAYLDTSPTPAKKRTTGKNSRKIWAGAVLLGFLPSLSTTFASSVTINNNSAIEFGQGSQTTSVCDSSIIVAIGTDWSQSDGFFRVSALTLSDLDTTPGACAGKVLTVNALDADGIPLDLNGASPGNSLSISAFTSISTTDTEEISISGAINSVDVARVTIETA